MTIYLRLLAYARPYLVFMVLSVCCMAIVSGTTAGIAYLVKPAIDGVFVKNSPDISVRDIAEWDRLHALAAARDPVGVAALLQRYLQPADLEHLQELPVGDIASQEKLMIVRALNDMKDDPGFYFENSGVIALEAGGQAHDSLGQLAAQGIAVQSPSGAWRIKSDPGPSEKTDLKWFAIAVLRELLPGTLTKSAQRDFLMLYFIPVLLVLAYLIKGAADFGQSYFMGYVGNRTVADLRELLYRHVQTLSLSFFTRSETGALMSRIANDVTVLRRSVSDSVKKTVQSVLLIIGLTGVAFYQNWKMAAVCFLVVPAVSWLIVRFGKRSKRYSRRTQRQLGRLSTFLDETISGTQTIKAFCMEGYASKRFVLETARLLKVSLKNLKIMVLASPVMEVCGGVMGALIIYYGGSQVVHGTMTTGEFSSFIAAIAMLYRPVKTLSKENIRIQRGMAAAVRVFEVLDIQSEIEDRPGAVELPVLRTAVEFRNVSFSYGDEPVLDRISFTARVGEAVALVGHSGVGKTTIANLLLRFYDVTAGGIFIDGIDIRDVTVASLRARIAFVAQETILFNDTVRNNIAYGSPHLSDAEIERAARAAFAHDFITTMPAGYDTVVGEKGVLVSGGQRQRIAIARALVKDAPILVLDEATSALDTQSEKIVQDALENLMRGRTTFIIAHRLATVRNADQILVLSGGRIVERGSHDDLMKQSGVYNSLINIQSGYKKKDTAAAAHIC